MSSVNYLLLVVRQYLIGSQVITRCPPLFVVAGVPAVIEPRSPREIDNIAQIYVQFTQNKTRGHISDVFRHSIE